MLDGAWHKLDIEFRRWWWRWERHAGLEVAALRATLAGRDGRIRELEGAAAVAAATIAATSAAAASGGGLGGVGVGAGTVEELGKRVRELEVEAAAAGRWRERALRMEGAAVRV